MIDNPAERINENIKHRLDREQDILNQLSTDQPRSVVDIVNAVYKVLKVFKFFFVSMTNFKI